MKRFVFIWIASLTLAMTVSNAAWAACSNPAGAAGEIIYNTDFNVMQYCDNTDWIGMSGGSGGGGSGVTDGDKGDVTVSGSGASWMIDDDVLDFTEFADSLTLDASTAITVTGSNVLSLVNSGTGDSFVVMDQASDTSPFVIAADGKVGVGIAAPTQALDVVGKVTTNSIMMKMVDGAAAPTGGSGSSGQWTTDGTHIWRASGRVGIGTATPGSLLHLLSDGTGNYIISTTYRSDSSYGGGLQIERARGTLVSPTIIQNADTTAFLYFRGYDGTNFEHSSGISGTIDGTPGNDDVPGMLNFWTTSDGSTSLTRRMVINAAGNVGIGTTSPGTPLDVVGTGRFGGATGVGVSGTDGAPVQNATLMLGAAHTAGYAWIQSYNVKPLAINPIGNNVGIGTTTPGSKLSVSNSTAGVNAVEAVNSSSTGDTVWLGQSGASGRVLALHKSGGSGDIMQAYYDPGGGYATRMTLSTAGAIWIASTITQNSDRTLKENIAPISGALEKLSAIQGVSYEWKDKSRGEGKQLGLIAQDVEKVFPEVVTASKEEGTKGVAYTSLIGPIISAINELKAENDILRAEIEALKAGKE